MDYLSEIKKLPREIQGILISSFGAEVNGEIINDFSLSDEQAGKFIDLVNDIYLKQVEVSELQEELSKRLSLNPKKTTDLAIDITGKKLLIADDYFKGKAINYLKSFGVNITTYAPIVARELNEIEKEREYIKDDESSSFTDVLDDANQDEDFIKQSKKDTLDLFKSDLGKILSLGPEYNDIISDYNDDLEEYLNDEDFKRDLKKIILNNKDVITRIKPIDDNESKEATIANWLKDFITFHGSSNFNTIVLAEYLVNSQSAKRLSLNDKKKIKRLLNIYKNASFFAEVATTNQEGVEVIPLENEIKEDSIVRENKKNEIKTAVEPQVIEDKVKEVKIEKPSLINELENMLQDYKEGTLEYKTILQEIKRLKSSK